MALPRYQKSCARQHAAVVGVAIMATALTVEAKCPVSEWIDPDTPVEVCIGKTDSGGSPMELVFSDEFNVDGRSFRDGEDPVWTAINGFPESNAQVNAYHDSAKYATTKDGMLRLLADTSASNMQFDEAGPQNILRPYTTPMLQTWNKFCYTEGILEMSAHLPGKATQPGLWPAFWVMGNLGRATVLASTDRIWPFSYSHCPDEADKDANQDPARNQEINACLGADFTAQYGLNPHQGRGAIEIDIVEAMPGDFDIDYKVFKVDTGACKALESQEEYDKVLSVRPMVATSLQLAPGMPFRADQRPMDSDAGDLFNCLPEDWSTQWYPELKPGTDVTYGTDYFSTANVDFWGDYFNGSSLELQTDSLSALNALPHAVFEGQHVYRMEWRAGSDGYVEFKLDDKLQFRVNSSSAERKHNITRDGAYVGEMHGRMMPEEPSYIMLNIDLSTRWGWPDCQEEHCACCTDCTNPNCTQCYYPWDPSTNRRQWLADLCELLPQYYEIDYVRVWQQPGNTRTQCSPKDYPTQGWIESHRDRYLLPNMNEPLRPVLAGGLDCLEDSDCGGSSRGLCTDGTCVCNSAWTGPRCLAQKAGTALTCAPLEAAAIGGAACYTTSSFACGVKRGRGKCVEAARPGGIYAPSQTNLLPDGTWEKSGGGDGRCQCNAGWAGSSCALPVDPDQCLPDQYFPNPAWMGKDLETFIEDLCNSSRAAQGSQVAKACDEVLWKPHWVSGGAYSVCGAWLRALWVASAAGCKKKAEPVEVDARLMIVIGGSVFVVVSLLGIFVTCMQRRKRVAKWGSHKVPSSQRLSKENQSQSRARSHSRPGSTNTDASQDTFETGTHAGSDIITPVVQGGLRKASDANAKLSSGISAAAPSERKVAFDVDV